MDLQFRKQSPTCHTWQGSYRLRQLVEQFSKSSEPCAEIVHWEQYYARVDYCQRTLRRVVYGEGWRDQMAVVLSQGRLFLVRLT